MAVKSFLEILAPTDVESLRFESALKDIDVVMTHDEPAGLAVACMISDEKLEVKRACKYPPSPCGLWRGDLNVEAAELLRKSRLVWP